MMRSTSSTMTSSTATRAMTSSTSTTTCSNRGLQHLFHRHKWAVLCYGSMLLAACLSGWMTLQGLDARDLEASSMHQVLQLITIEIIVEEAEAHVKAAELADKVQEQQAAWTAQTFQKNVQIDQDQAAHAQKEVDAFELAAHREEDKAQQLWTKYNQTDEERLELLQLLKKEKQDEDKAIQELREAQVHQGMCTWQGMQKICAMVGGVTELQQEINQDDIQIHQNVKLLDEMEHREYLEKVVAQALQNQVDKYNETATDLRATAQSWLQRAAQDQQRAAVWNYTAMQLQQQELQLEAREELFHTSTQQMSDVKRRLIDSANNAEKVSKRYFVAALCLAVAPLIFFIIHAVRLGLETLSYLEKWIQAQQHQYGKKDLVGRTVTYGVLHFLSFVTIASWCREFVPYLDFFALEKRAVLVFYFSFLLAMTQNVTLHCIPHLISEYRNSLLDGVASITEVLMEMAKPFVLRTTFFVPLFAMELVIVWLVRPLRILLLLNPCLWSRTKQTFMYLFFIWILLGYYYIEISRRPATYQQPQDVNGETIAILSRQQQEEEEVSLSDELSPLQSTADAGTFPQVYKAAGSHGNNATSAQDQPIVNNPTLSSFHVDVHRELHRLILVLDFFLMFCMLLVMNIGCDSLVSEGSPFAGVLFVILVILLIFVLMTIRSSRQFLSSTAAWSTDDVEFTAQASSKTFYV